jgi:hypothetical protein
VQSLIFNHITSPVGRAGGANMSLPVIGMGIFLLVKVLALPILSAITFGGLILLMLYLAIRTYVTTLAKIDFLDDRIQMLLAIYAREVKYDSIESVEIVHWRLSLQLRVKIRSKRFGHGILCTVPGRETALGSLEKVSALLATEFRAKGIETITRSSLGDLHVLILTR